jgi:hypothetical protein
MHGQQAQSSNYDIEGKKPILAWKMPANTFWLESSLTKCNDYGHETQPEQFDNYDIEGKAAPPSLKK